MMTPYYQDEAVTIYLGDCREVCLEFDTWQFDLLLTDPPYGLGKKMSGGTWGKADKYSDMWKWDITPDALDIEIIRARAKVQIIWGGNNFVLPPSRCWLIWDKQNAVHTVADCEMAWTNIDKPIKRLSAPVGVHDTGHPTQKPLSLIEWSINQAGEVKTILDPFGGSGTTGRAAKNLGKSCVLIEREEKYCEIAAKRMGQGVLL